MPLMPAIPRSADAVQFADSRTQSAYVSLARLEYPNRCLRSRTRSRRLDGRPPFHAAPPARLPLISPCGRIGPLATSTAQMRVD